jgi:hypothetical protein
MAYGIFFGTVLHVKSDKLCSKVCSVNRLRKNPRNTAYFLGLATAERGFARHFLDFCCAGGPESCRATDSRRDYAAAVSSLGIRTTLYAAAANVNIHPTNAVPRCRVLRNPPTVLIQPNTSSMRLRTRTLIA